MSNSDEDQQDRALFVDVEVDGEVAPGEAWNKLKQELVEGATSVEVLPVDNGEKFIFRIWQDLRRDHSNAIEGRDSVEG